VSLDSEAWRVLVDDGTVLCSDRVLGGRGILVESLLFAVGHVCGHPEEQDRASDLIGSTNTEVRLFLISFVLAELPC
jgi:hypothetical protein